MEIHSSPRSSTGGVDSFKGTPDTRLTTFSQHESFNKSINLPKGPGRSDFITSPVNVPVKESSNAFSGLDKDPFVTSVHGVSTRLSPTASAFSPFHSNATLSVSTNAPPIASAVSTDMGLSRDLNISSSMPLSAQEVDIWLTELHSMGGHWHGARYLTTLKGHVFIHFTDIRDSCSIHTRICLTMKEWKAAYIFPEHLTKDNTFSYEASVARTGQVFVVAVVPFNSSVSTISAMEAACQTLQSHGRLFAFVRQSIFSDGCFKAVAEFCDTSAAHHAMASCNNITTFEGVRLSVTPYYTDCTSTSDLIEAMQDISFAKGQSGFDPHYSAPGSIKPRQRPPHDVVAQESYPTYPLMSQPSLGSNMPYMLDTVISTIHLNATGPLTPLSSPYSVGGRVYKTPPSPALTAHNGYSPSRNLPGVNRVDVRRQNAMRISRSPYHNLPSHHNQVEINRIRDGIDVRTTIMLRNIPNKVDQTMLKRIVDESSWGKYDFMYLRIDFANDCNVGYAFINFVDPLDITDFVEARGNQRWNCFKSDKIAEISYATIQGKDCLVQKFRNSSVMLEAPHYRPKLYFTSNGPMPEFAGQEEPFPEPDNQSKMKRSCENAEHVGLFTPNAGQHFRDEQRRRRSQYDRGTRLAALEEYDYEAALQHLYDPSNH